ncbi:MAG: HD domain-containing protein, partial [Bacteroidales bacterium]|nr:HD domain-containing protein [Bacteroidales bacterium]
MKNRIIEIENKWLNKLYNLSKLSFNKCHLPSHDQNHHLRVWHYCKEIIQNNDRIKYFSYFDIENIIIACFFHDIGMTKTIDIRHGIESRKICEIFFAQNKSIKPKGYIEILDAIEKHDNKEYKKKKKDLLYILSVLSLADDIDAYGIIGVLRYLEIYYLRDNNILKLSDDILINLEKRYNNFITKYPYLEKFNEIHT